MIEARSALAANAVNDLTPYTVGRIGQVVIRSSIFTRFTNDSVIRPCAGTDYSSVET